MKRILCLCLPHWPLQRLLVAQPELESQAVVLHARGPRGGESVVICCRKAWTRGIRPGMSLAEAGALTRRTTPSSTSDHGEPVVPRPYRGQHSSRQGGVWFQLHDPQADRQALESLAQRCESFSPLVGLDHPQQAEGLWLDITGVTQRWGGELELAWQLAEMVRQQGYQGRLALADTLGAAWGLARYGLGPSLSHEPPQPTDSFTTSSQRNEGIWPPPLRIPPGETRQALRPLPVQALRLSDTTVQLLQRLGIERIEQLLELPRAGLAARLGDEVLQRWDQATGKLEEILVPYRPAPRFQAQWTLDSSTSRRQTIQHVIQHLCHHVAQQLATHDQGAVQVRCRLLNDSRRPVVMEVALFHPTAHASHLFQLLRMQLESVKLPAAVNAVHLLALTTTPLHRQQSSLWVDFPSHQNHPQQLAQLIDRLSSRLGADVVRGVRLRAGALPEEAYITAPLTGPAASPARLKAVSAARPALQPHQRPLQLVTPPWPLKGMWVAPEGPPVWFHYLGHKYQVQHHWGPERIETAWWQGCCVRRDYYRVECTSGQRFWLFRRLTDHRWFLHGHFE